mmetsp:Transcript_68893/g.109299  ORF Transcript_68893/g.109299 Transcript_68893/m.109299 type:complete len:122 (-) Transcript_68893:663-1028(-)
MQPTQQAQNAVERMHLPHHKAWRVFKRPQTQGSYHISFMIFFNCSTVTQVITTYGHCLEKVAAKPLYNDIGPSVRAIVVKQLSVPVYSTSPAFWFISRVLATSTGFERTDAKNAAMKLAEK